MDEIFALTMKVAELIQSGNSAFAIGNYAQALLCYQKALELVRGDPDLLADLYGNIGNVYGATGQIDQAVLYYQKAIEILRQKEDYGRLGTTFTNIGNLYADRGEAQKAIHFYKQGIVLLEREERWGELVTLYGNLSLLSLQQEDFSSALQYAEKGVTIAKRIKDPARLADALHQLAKANGALGKVQIAQGLSEAAHALYVQLNDEMGCAATLYHQASLFEEKGEFDGAIRCLTQVVAIDEKYNLPKLAENRARLARLRARVEPSP